MKIKILIFILAISLSLFAQGENESKEVIAKGLGAILAGDEVKAKEDATAAALRSAVEQVVGTLIESNTLVENYQTVEDNIYSQTSGYVQKWDLISANKQSDNVMEVTIRATVKLTDLQNDLAAIGVLLARKGKPRTMILVDERNINENYAQLNADLNTTETTIMNEFMNFGFPFVDPTTVKMNLSRESAMAAVQGNPEAAAAIANQHGAEIIITGTAISKVASGAPAVVKNAGFKSCQANLNLRVIRADDGSIIAVSNAHDRAAHIDEVTGGSMALQKASKAAANDLKDKIIAAWQKDVYSSSQVQLMISNVSSFSQLSTLKNSMKFYVRGVQAVHQRSFSGGVALFDVDIKGNAEQLASELEAKEIEGIKFQVTGMTANKVTATIVQ